MYGPALLEPVEPHEAKSSSTEALRTAGRLLRPGEIVAVWGRRTTEATAHEAIHRDHLLTEAASNYKIAVDDPKEALYPMIKRGGCDHYLWRTPEGEPQAVVLIATDRSWSIEGPVAVRKPRPVAIAPL